VPPPELLLPPEPLLPVLLPPEPLLPVLPVLVASLGPAPAPVELAALVDAVCCVVVAPFPVLGHWPPTH
jgi:hypothetical protein